MKRVAVVLFALALHANAQKLQPKVDWAKWAPLMDLSGAEAGDVITTHTMLKNPYNHEMFLPDWISHNVYRMSIYSGVRVATDGVMAWELRKHHHDKLAMWAPVVDAEVVSLFDVRNMMLPTKNFPTWPKLPGHLP